MAEFSAYNKFLRALRLWRCDPYAVLVCVDVRDLRTINHIGTPRAGDAVLEAVQKRLHSWATPSGLSERLWSNEFAAVKHIDHPQDAIDEVTRLRDALAGIRYESLLGDIRTGVAIGLTVVRPGVDWPQALDQASEACQAAKTRGVNQIVSRAPKEAAGSLMRNTDIVRHFREFLAEGRLNLYPQPIMDISGPLPRLAKAEFLLRVEQGGQSRPLPKGTVEALEFFGLTSELDGYVTQHVLDWLAAHPVVLHKLDNVSLNLSARSLVDGNFMDSLLKEVRRSPVPPAKLCFEITETAAVENLDVAAEMIEEFRRLGCRWSLDDFGSGLCSFGYLHSLRVDEVKIDGRFTKDLQTNPVTQEIVRAINQVAHAAGKKTVAEFVDEQVKLDMLRAMGVDYAQGWLFSPAVAPEEFLKLLDPPRALAA